MSVVQEPEMSPTLRKLARLGEELGQEFKAMRDQIDQLTRENAAIVRTLMRARDASNADDLDLLHRIVRGDHRVGET